MLPEEMSDVEEGTYLAATGDLNRGVHVFNALIGKPKFIAEVLNNKAHGVCRAIKDYTSNLQDEQPQEMRTMLQYSV